jgi:hypothetical protein
MLLKCNRQSVIRALPSSLAALTFAAALGTTTPAFSDRIDDFNDYLAAAFSKEVCCKGAGGTFYPSHDPTGPLSAGHCSFAPEVIDQKQTLQKPAKPEKVVPLPEARPSEPASGGSSK